MLSKNAHDAITLFVQALLSLVYTVEDSKEGQIQNQACRRNQTLHSVFRAIWKKRSLVAL